MTFDRQLSLSAERGFTLLEVLIATAIVGLTIPALMLLMMKQADNAGSLRDKAIATWIADNQMVRLRLERQLSQSTLRSTVEERIEMAGTEWLVVTEPEKTTVGALLRYRTTVGFERDEPIVTLDGYIH
ncbi:MAG: general secretion pathway protein I [Candidatus Endobugula sp.]|jgi:general secretion pathway protein I